MKTPQVKPDWATGIYIGNGVVAEDIRSKVARMTDEELRKLDSNNGKA